MNLNKFASFLSLTARNLKVTRQCHSVFGIKHIIQRYKPDNFTIHRATKAEYESALDIMKKHFLSENIFVLERNMDLYGDCALDEYLIKLLRQGNTFYVKAESGAIAGICVNYVTTPDDAKEIRDFAFYRQDPNTKDYLYFTAKLMETPNLWDLFKQPYVFEIKMMSVLPEYRRQGLATVLMETSKQHAQSEGYKVLRLDCINPIDYKVAESAMLRCVVKYPAHKLSGPHVSFVKRSHIYNSIVRVYVHLHTDCDDEEQAYKSIIKQKQALLEKYLE